MKIGDIVKNKITGEYGTCHYSRFGISIHTYDEERKILSKDLGLPVEQLNEKWEVCNMPDNYKWDNTRLFIRKK